MFVMGKLGIRETSPSKAKHVMVSLTWTVIMAINIVQTDFTVLHVQKYVYERVFQCIHIHIYSRQISPCCTYRSTYMNVHFNVFTYIYTHT